MKPPHKCPECDREFPRKYNMRVHCKTQHNYDPFPNTQPLNLSSQNTFNKTDLVYSSPSTQDVGGTGGAVERFLSTMQDYLTPGELRFAYGPNANMTSMNGSEDKALLYLADNFALVRKSEITGISGHLCKNCLSLEYQLIKDIGFDLTAKERHRCKVPMMYSADSSLNNASRFSELRTQLHESLIKISDKIFNGEKSLIVQSNIHPTFLANMHAVKMNFQTITPTHWAWNLILSKKTKMTDFDFRNFIWRAAGSYVHLIIESGACAGHHLIYIKTEPVS